MSWSAEWRRCPCSSTDLYFVYMSSELRKSAEFFVELAEGLTRLTQDKDKLVQLVNYEVAALLNSLSKGARLRERDLE